jgi:serine/threonine protein kinase
MLHRLKHANVIELIGYGWRPEHGYFIVMELMENGTLHNGTFFICQFFRYLVDVKNFFDGRET